jgi:hypothetical protein
MGVFAEKTWRSRENPLGRDEDPAGSCEKLPTAIELLRPTFGEFGMRSGNSSG